MTLVYDGRCAKCYMRNEVCICSDIPSIQTRTQLTLLMHFRENYKTTNSGRIACMALPNSKIIFQGLKNKILSESDVFEPNYQPVLLTLSDRSTVLTKSYIDSFNKPIQLIVPDGNWRQASKMGKRISFLKDIPWVKLPLESVQLRARLRAEHHREGMSTIEAIARAMGIIEDTNIDQSLDRLYDTMVRKTLSTRPPNRAEMNHKLR